MLLLGIGKAVRAAAAGAEVVVEMAVVGVAVEAGTAEEGGAGGRPPCQRASRRVPSPRGAQAAPR